MELKYIRAFIQLIEKNHLETHGNKLRINLSNYRRFINLSQLHRGLGNYIEKYNSKNPEQPLKTPSNKTMTYRVQALLRNLLDVDTCIEQMQENMNRRGRKPIRIYQELAKDFETVYNMGLGFTKGMLIVKIGTRHDLSFPTAERLYKEWLNNPDASFPKKVSNIPKKEEIKKEKQRQKRLKDAQRKKRQLQREARKMRIALMRADLKKK
ncbi:hypothetical protein CKF54_05025 [Psittacicella hinzii]|uniref:Uncharacterized protein n=1 Tax=Psittacicella hinzii TaxID=2028575 RepID=A0A3A1Y4P1_9GAMM|nr:hypothetical protein CKF54_05025 [Psittacicella hinzii]